MRKTLQTFLIGAGLAIAIQAVAWPLAFGIVLLSGGNRAGNILLTLLQPVISPAVTLLQLFGAHTGALKETSIVYGIASAPVTHIDLIDPVLLLAVNALLAGLCGGLTLLAFRRRKPPA